MAEGSIWRSSIGVRSWVAAVLCSLAGITGLIGAFPSEAGAVRFPASTLDVYVDSQGNFNLALPGESEGLFEDEPGTGISPGESGLALWVNQLSGSVGVGQATAFQGVGGPEVVYEDSQTRLIETSFSVLNGESTVLDITQSIAQSKVSRSVLVSYTITNNFGDNITLRPYILGNLRLDSTNTATPTYIAAPVPRLTVTSTTSSRSLQVFPVADQSPESVGVGPWSDVGVGRPSAGIAFSPFISSPITDPAFGVEWSTWVEGTLPASDSASVSATYIVSSSLPEPTRGSTAVVEPVRGTVLVKAPGGRFNELEAGEEIPVGSLVDTRNGTVRLTSAGAGGTNQTADFRYGLFRVSQKKSSPLTNLALAGRVSGCRRASRSSATRTLAPRALRGGRTLWGRGKGKFKVSGKRGSGSVRGTTWQVTDRCDGSTLVKSISGVVEARDFGKGKKFRKVLRSGQSYVARPRR